MTKGKIVLELLIDAKSAMKNFDQSGASFGSHMTTMDSGIISKKKSQKTHFWGPFHKFFSRIPNNFFK